MKLAVLQMFTDIRHNPTTSAAILLHFLQLFQEIVGKLLLVSPFVHKGRLKTIQYG